MPFTLFHFGPSASIAFPLNRLIDIPVFVLANVAVDLEPLAVIVFNLSYPLHGYVHSFLGAGFIGALWGIVAFKGRVILGGLMHFFGLKYQTTMIKAIVSGITGAVIHVLLDAPIYTDIRPFYPLHINPLYGSVSQKWIYVFCSLSFIPALLFFINARKNQNVEGTWGQS